MKMIRTVTVEECPWVIDDIEKGTEVFNYIQCTYGCITSSGIAITFQKDGKGRFYEVPKDSVR